MNVALLLANIFQLTPSSVAEVEILLFLQKIN